MSNITIENLKKYCRAVNYLSAAQIFLQNNYLLEKPLSINDIKSRLLGHWGTCPGISFVYANLNFLLKKYVDADFIYVVGPGHGFPAVQANSFIEGTLGEYYPQATVSKSGIEYISKNFSWPYGFPSHSSPHTPGVILEGGELGYSLSTSYGAVLDNPKLIAVCLVGDGEAETGPTATAWHINKFIDPRNNGAVLPILHLNGYKISGPTIYGRMSNEELTKLFEGYGYDVHILEKAEDDEEKIYEDAANLMDEVYKKIRQIQADARIKNETVVKPKWPLIILKTPKGWTGIKELDGKKIEGNHYSHQVVLKDPRTKNNELVALEKWLKSYKFEELFDEQNGFIKEVTDLIPDGNRRVGKNKHTFGGPDVYKPLVLPDPNNFSEPVTKPGVIGSSSMIRVGEYLNEVFKLNADAKNFRFFSPDETYSNKLDKIFATTKRAWVWPTESFDEDLNPQGRVIEMLSEHTLQGLMQGYVLTGRHGIFASYESFIQIISSMADQYAKFLKQAKEVKWRGNIPSLNYILTSSGWRQEHNGFSHQNPGFIDDMLQRQGDFINVYFPADGNSALAVIDECLNSSYGINVIVAGKTLEPRWVDVDFAKEQLKEGLAIWNFASQENPDIVFAAAGDYLTKEALAAIDLLRQELPEIKPRFVNVSTLSWSGFGAGNNVLKKQDFTRFFTEDKPVVFNYHGYPQTIKQILFDYAENPKRFKVNGYNENGSTTTSFDMQLRNGTSRYDLLLDAVKFLKENNKISSEAAQKIVDKYNLKIAEFKKYIVEFGVDPEEISEWQWKK
jgi:xylulose-5-phosphate/fructose-6-phosphate phosphoketolase